jgi:hypothetical protein
VHIAPLGHALRSIKTLKLKLLLVLFHPMRHIFHSIAHRIPNTEYPLILFPQMLYSKAGHIISQELHHNLRLS